MYEGNLYVLAFREYSSRSLGESVQLLHKIPRQCRTVEGTQPLGYLLRI